MIDLFGKDDNQLDIHRFLERAEALAREIPSKPQPIRGLSASATASVLKRIRNLIQRLEDLVRALDPITHSDVYDPSHPTSAADLIAARLVSGPSFPLAEVKPFYGAGVYALYYRGDHPAYRCIRDAEIPIYVGKAEAADRVSVRSIEQGDKIYRRLMEHLKSIRATERHTQDLEQENLAAEGIHPLRETDFECRWMVLAGAYAAAVEQHLIQHHRPVWNKETKICLGFGKHGDSAETRSNTRSDWDTLHPGRTWATKEGNVPNPRTPQEITLRIIEHTCR